MCGSTYLGCRRFTFLDRQIGGGPNEPSYCSLYYIQMPCQNEKKLQHSELAGFKMFGNKIVKK